MNGSKPAAARDRLLELTNICLLSVLGTQWIMFPVPSRLGGTTDWFWPME